MRRYLSLRREEVSDPESWDGVGLVKSEYPGMTGFDDEFIESTSFYLGEVCQQFLDKPVWYRTNDSSSKFLDKFTSSKLNEVNPHFGLRGVRRSILHDEEFKAEIGMINKLRLRYANLNILLPFVNDIFQYKMACEMARRTDYTGKIGMMVETPAAILLLDHYYRAGCRYFVFGMNDMSDCLNGASRKNQTNILIRRDPEMLAMKKLLAMVDWHPGAEYVISGEWLEPELHKMVKKPFTGVAIPCGVKL